MCDNDDNARCGEYITKRFSVNFNNNKIKITSHEPKKNFKDDYHIRNFMAFILILCSFIMNNIFKYKNLSILNEGVDINTKGDISILRETRIKNRDIILIATLNVNSLPAKFEQMKVIIGNYIDIIVIQETKLDPSFSTEQFIINGYKKPYRLDRNRNGGGVIIYIREDIPSKVLQKHNFTKNIEGIFVEINFKIFTFWNVSFKTS